MAIREITRSSFTTSAIRLGITSKPSTAAAVPIEVNVAVWGATPRQIKKMSKAITMTSTATSGQVKRQEPSPELFGDEVAEGGISAFPEYKAPAAGERGRDRI